MDVVSVVFVAVASRLFLTVNRAPLIQKPFPYSLHSAALH